MLKSNICQNGYNSCIRVHGVPILPPLITEERRKELNNDKQRAIEIEKKLKGKRSSIDSGVMTGSYIEHFKNIELQQNDESNINEDLTLKVDDENITPKSNSGMENFCAVNHVVSDSFLKTALEDPEFREFFSTTAEKIFKDNKIENIFSFSGDHDLNSYAIGLNQVPRKESETQSLEASSQSSLGLFVKPPESLDFSFSDGPSRVPSLVDSDINLKCSEGTRIIEDVSDGKQVEEEPSSPVAPRIRRNSYTLDSPSTVLLEHLAKEIVEGKEGAEKWYTPSGKNDKSEGLGFKTFSAKNQRKHWNKNICNQSNSTKYNLGRSNTFIKHDEKGQETNYSPSGTSPLQLCPFTRSVDCIKTMVANPHNEQIPFVTVRPESVAKINVSQVPYTDAISCKDSDSESCVVHPDCELQSVSEDTSPISLANNPSCGPRSTCSTVNCSPPRVEFSDSASQISVTSHLPYHQQTSDCAQSTNNENVSKSVGRLEDFDDIASLCSSMSISRFLPVNDVSRPSTAEEVSEADICLLKKKHENELRNLLEKQRKEEEIYSQLLSTSGSVSSRTTTNLSIGDLFEPNCEVLSVNERDSCSRELFPSLKTSLVGTKTTQRDNYSEREKGAATKINACVKGYLTRRLLKTEKVQKLIELIKESLSCAFSLQLEPQLKPTDLELHARLAYQLNAALCELQNIVDAPVATRMAIIAADRERLRRPASRPSSAISLATRKSILRRQQSLTSNSEKKPHESRSRTKSFSISGSSGSRSSGSHVRSDSASTVSTNSSRVPWR